MTGGRLKRVKKYIENERAFCLTYGDGVGDIDITSLIEFHLMNRTKATLTATRPPGRYGALKLTQSRVEHFQEKPDGDGSWINGGFFVLDPKVIDLIESDQSSFENDVLKKLADEGELSAFTHDGFWQPMDTLREKNILNSMWYSGDAPWKVWK